MEKTWSFSKKGFIKVYDTKKVRGVVLRDHRGTIIKMYSGTIRNLTPRDLKLCSMLMGLRGFFFERVCKIELEIDRQEALNEWDKWHWFLDPNHASHIQQLELGKKDFNLFLVTRVVKPSEKRLAHFFLLGMRLVTRPAW